MTPKISVIVPAYKVEEYLPRCMESLMSQTYKDFEIILVDDGSPDTCPAMCDAYAKKYSNIHALHKENGGLSDARNVGMTAAKGEYVTFVDSDDYVHSAYLEMLMQGIRQGADFSVCGFTEVYDGNGIEDLDTSRISAAYVNAKEGLVEILYQGFHDVSAWGILLPASLARKYPFPKGKLFEDLYTTYKFYLAAETVAFIRVPLYYYFQRKGSIMGRRNEAFIHDLIESSDQLVEACREKGAFIEQAAMNKQFSNYCRLILQPSELEDKHPQQYQRIVDMLKRERLSVLLDGRARGKNRLAALALFGGRCRIEIGVQIELLVFGHLWAFWEGVRDSNVLQDFCFL